MLHSIVLVNLNIENFLGHFDFCCSFSAIFFFFLYVDLTKFYLELCHYQTKNWRFSGFRFLREAEASNEVETIAREFSIPNLSFTIC